MLLGEHSWVKHVDNGIRWASVQFFVYFYNECMPRMDYVLDCYRLFLFLSYCVCFLLYMLNFVNTLQTNFPLR